MFVATNVNYKFVGGSGFPEIFFKINQFHLATPDIFIFSLLTDRLFLNSTTKTILTLTHNVLLDKNAFLLSSAFMQLL